MPSPPVTASHMTQSKAEYESAIPRGTDEGLDLWEAFTVVLHIMSHARRKRTITGTKKKRSLSVTFIKTQ